MKANHLLPNSKRTSCYIHCVVFFYLQFYSRGGAPGSYSPKFESTSPTSFGDWASSVDLLPVPVEYQLMPIYEIIPSTWKVDNFSIQELYMNATEKYLASVLESISSIVNHTLLSFFCNT